jgi:hypothetical protein
MIPLLRRVIDPFALDALEAHSSPFLPYAVFVDPADGFSDIGWMYC